MTETPVLLVGPDGKTRIRYAQLVRCLLASRTPPCAELPFAPSGAFRFIWIDSLTEREIGRVRPVGRDVPCPRSPSYICMVGQDAFEAELRGMQRHATAVTRNGVHSPQLAAEATIQVR
jgi:hypothetical protein